MNKCTNCGQSLTNLSADENEPNWVCENTRCVESDPHKKNSCPICGEPPAEIKHDLSGTAFTVYLCKNGHKYEKHYHR